MPLTNNTLTLMALSSEYCQAAENAGNVGRTDFIDNMLRLLPRLYITAQAIEPGVNGGYGELSQALTEDVYDAVRSQISVLLGEDDTYLEVFVADMKYSDTPIALSIAEGLADIYQALYNYLETVRDAVDDVIDEATAALHTEFITYWSQALCNVLRPLNSLRYDQ